DLVCRLVRDQPEPALDLGQRGLDVEVLLRPVLVGPDVAHLVAREDALEDGGVDDGGGHGGFLLKRGWFRRRRAEESAVPAARRAGRSFGRRAARRRATRPRRRARVAPTRGLDRSVPARHGWARPGADGCKAWRRSRIGATTRGRPAAAARRRSVA